MSESMKFKLVCTYKPFMHAGSVRLGLFSKRDIGLHLNTEGTNTIKRFILHVFFYNVNYLRLILMQT